MSEKQKSLSLIYEDINLRPLCLGDCKPYYLNWLNDSKVNSCLETRHQLQTLDSIIDYVKTVSMDSANYHFAIILREKNKHIGNIKLGPINHVHQTAEISYFIGDISCWGNGYASQAIKCVANFAFNSLGLIRLQAGCYESNIGSIKVLQKCGFLQEGVLRKKFMNADRVRESMCVFGLLNEEVDD